MALLEALPGLEFPVTVNPPYVPQQKREELPEQDATHSSVAGEAQAASPEADAPLELLDRFFQSRQLAAEVPGVRDERQEAIRNDVKEWFKQKYPDIAAGKPGTVEDYSVAAGANASMLGSLVEYLQDNHFGRDGMSGPELYASQDFLAANFALHEGAKNGADLSPGKESHAFVVPVRLSSIHPYSDEIRPLVPAFHYVPDELVHHFMRDLPTFVADRYVGGGYVMVAPVTYDMGKDLGAQSVSTFRKAAQARVNGAITLAKAMGAREFGLGATFPGLMKLGEAAISEDTTTGHGGTTALMVMLIDKLSREVMPNGEPPRIGVLGLGQIGLPAAEVVADFYPDTQVNVFDIKPQALANMLTKVTDRDRYTVAESIKQLIEKSDIILSTITTTLNFEDPTDPYFVDIKNLEGKYFIDDSEPHGLRPEQVTKLGGVVLDVIGRDYSGEVLKRDSDFGYGGTLVNRELDAFGCELEAALLSHCREQFLARGYTPEEAKAVTGWFALRRPVTANDTRNWIELFNLYNISPAPYQVFGKEYQVSKPKWHQKIGRAIVTAFTGGKKRFAKSAFKLAP